MRVRVRRYIIEFNRIIYDDIRRGARILQRRFGLNVQLVPHKTTMIVRPPSTMSWASFRRAIAAMLQPRRGSAVIFSEWSGRSYLCSNVGNRPGRFQTL